MLFHPRRVSRFLCIATLAASALCAVSCSNGPSMKQRADESTERGEAAKKQEAFGKSLPPTQSKPIFKP